MSRVEGGDDKESNQVIPLHGRQTYARSSRWNYYTVLDSGVQIPIMMDDKNCTSELGCEELFDDDVIEIPDLGASYTLRLYESTKHRYIPYYTP
jgi:hypothetical protein